MEIVQSAANLIKFVIGNQTIDSNKEYRLLNFCLPVFKDDVVLLFNNLTKELVVLNSEEAKLICEPSFRLSSSLLTKLAERWFLVPCEFDDMKLSNQVTTFARQLKITENVTNFVIVTTTACNARCFYCFEAGSEISTMSAETALDVSKYIVKRSNEKKVNIKWFGGEPLCNKNVINIISKYLTEKNIDFSASMVSNGYLFDEATVANAVSLWKIKSVQITLDGLEKTYNQVKNYVVKDDNPFKRVINNIGLLLDSKVSVMVRLNMDTHNSQELFDLVDYLYSLFGQKRGFTTYVQLLYENTGKVKTSYSDIESKSLIDAFFKLRKYIDSLGILGRNLRLPSEIKTSFCYADDPTAVQISPKGMIGRCEHYVDKLFVSDIYSDNNFEPWKKYSLPIKRCVSCAYYPSCLRLADCPNCATDCYDYEQKIKLLDMEKQISCAYEKFLKENRK